MKKISKNQILGLATLSGGLLGILSKTKALKIVGFGVAGISAGVLLKDMFKEEKKKVELQCQETEKIIEDSGLDLTKVDETDLMASEGEEELVFGKILLREAYRSCVFSDDMLEYDSSDFLGTLHVMQNVEKNRIIISIPLPRRSKKGLCPQDVREHFSDIYEEFIEEHNLDMQVFLNQIGVHVGLGDDGYTYYQELERDEDEKFQEYLERITRVIDAWENGDKAFHAKYKHHNDTETIRFEQYLNLEFPVFPKTSNKKGLDLITAMSLLNVLTENMSIYANNTGREHSFMFNHIAFHPTDDYGTILQIKDKELVTVDL